MRVPWPLLLLMLAAAGGAAWLFLASQGADVREDFDPGAGPARDPLRGDGPAPLTVAETVPIGIWGRDAVLHRPLPDPESWLHRELHFPPGTTELTGAVFLDAFEKAVGRDVPIRFPNEEALAAFRAARLDHAPPTPEDHVYVLNFFDVGPEFGFHVERHDGYLIVRPRDDMDDDDADGSESRGDEPSGDERSRDERSRDERSRDERSRDPARDR